MSTSILHLDDCPRARPQLGLSIFPGVVLSAVLAAVVTEAVAFAARLGLSAPPEFAPLAAGSVFLPVVLATAGAALVLAFIYRYSDRPERSFLLVSVSAFAASLVAAVVRAVALAESPREAAVALLVLTAAHVAAATVVVPSLLAVAQRSIEEG